MSRFSASEYDQAGSITILVASVLKPIRDIRHYHKLSWALKRHLPAARFYFAGYGKPQAANEFCLFQGERLSFARLWASCRLLWLMWRLRPQVIMVCSLELLPAAWCYHLFFGAYIILDLQENYEANVRTHEGYRLRLLWAYIVRLCYRFFLPRVQCVLYAEACYAEEIEWLRKHPHALWIANKVRRHALPLAAASPFRLVLTGTLSRLFGLYEAVTLCRKLHALDSRYHLVLAGQLSPALSAEELNFLNLPFIDNRQAAFEPLDYATIEECLRQGGTGLMLYHPKASIAGRIPTKLYEYLSWAMPIVGTAHPLWIQTAELYAPKSYYPLPLSQIEDPSTIAKLHEWLMQALRYTPEPTVFFETTEAPKLQAVAQQIEAHCLRRLERIKRK